MNIRIQGFTLIELLVVVLIIGILAAIALPKYQTAIQRTKLAEVEIIVQAYIGAQERYRLATGDFARYPYRDKFDIVLPIFNKNNSEKDRDIPSKILVSHATGGGFFTATFINSGQISSKKTSWSDKGGIGLQVRVDSKTGKIGIVDCRFISSPFGSWGSTYTSPAAKAC